MNTQRRKAIEKIIGQVEYLENQICDIAGEEQEAYDNLPKSIQYSERGIKMEDAIDSLHDAANYMRAVIDSVNEIFG